MHQTTIDYHEIEQRLQQAGVGCDPSWLHGALFGLIALHDDGHHAPCEGLSQVMAGLDALDDEVRELYRETWQTLDGPGLDFGMLLPSETDSLEQQAQGVLSWTRGYLDGLQCGGFDTLEFPVVSGRHAMQELRDLLETSLGELAGDEEALHETIEHAWVTAVLVRELLVVARERGEG